jgi:hypothetical protein
MAYYAIELLTPCYGTPGEPGTANPPGNLVLA